MSYEDYGNLYWKTEGCWVSVRQRILKDVLKKYISEREKSTESVGLQCYGKFYYRLVGSMQRKYFIFYLCYRFITSSVTMTANTHSALIQGVFVVRIIIALRIWKKNAVNLSDAHVTRLLSAYRCHWWTYGHVVVESPKQNMYLGRKWEKEENKKAKCVNSFTN